MKCPECEAWTIVLESRPLKTKNVLFRRRECANLHRFVTHETAIRPSKTRKENNPLERVEPVSKSDRQRPATTQSKATKTKT